MATTVRQPPLFSTAGNSGILMRCRKCRRNTVHSVEASRDKNGARVLTFKCRQFFTRDYCSGSAVFTEEGRDAVTASKLRTLSQTLQRALEDSL